MSIIKRILILSILFWFMPLAVVAITTDNDFDTHKAQLAEATYTYFLFDDFFDYFDEDQFYENQAILYLGGLHNLHAESKCVTSRNFRRYTRHWSYPELTLGTSVGSTNLSHSDYECDGDAFVFGHFSDPNWVGSWQSRINECVDPIKAGTTDECLIALSYAWGSTPSTHTLFYTLFHAKRLEGNDVELNLIDHDYDLYVPPYQPDYPYIQLQGNKSTMATSTTHLDFNIYIPSTVHPDHEHLGDSYIDIISGITFKANNIDIVDDDYFFIHSDPFLFFQGYPLELTESDLDSVWQLQVALDDDQSNILCFDCVVSSDEYLENGLYQWEADFIIDPNLSEIGIGFDTCDTLESIVLGCEIYTGYPAMKFPTLHALFSSDYVSGYLWGSFIIGQSYYEHYIDTYDYGVRPPVRYEEELSEFDWSLMGNLWDKVRYAWPLGYMTRLIEIFTMPFTETDVPELSFTFTESFPSALVGETIAFDVFKDENWSAVQAIRVDGSQNTIWDVIIPTYTIIIYLGVFGVILYDLLGLRFYSENETPSETTRNKFALPRTKRSATIDMRHRKKTHPAYQINMKKR